MKRSNDFNDSSEEEENTGHDEGHLYEKNVPVKFSCLYCISTFSRPDNLRKHCRKFHPSYPWRKSQASCDQCQKSYSSHKYLKKHKQKAHKENVSRQDRRMSFQCRH